VLQTWVIPFDSIEERGVKREDGRNFKNYAGMVSITPVGWKDEKCGVPGLRPPES
jgi:hypothetical protein